MRSEAWDGSNLKFTFRRTMDSRLMRQWEELLQVAESIEFREDDEDAVIWQFESLEDIQFNHFMQLLIIGGGSNKFLPRWSGKLLSNFYGVKNLE
jgi:hypothetical protein